MSWQPDAGRTLRTARLPALSLMLSLSLLAAGGCGGNLSLPQETLDRARAAVQTALDAWKSGDPPAKLAGLTQPIVMTDPDWNPKTGSRLLAHEIKKVEGVKGQHARCTVVLSIQPRQGKNVEKEVIYEVQVAEKILIGRDPLH